jgi:D-arabinose 1-dehydrogenase-like Zn-dependent alcohol dehydrogenase
VGTMRAMAIVEYGQPLQRVDLAVPSPGPESVLVRVHACGVSYSDYKTATGHILFSDRLRLPHVAGHEIVGDVVERGLARDV